MVSQTQSVRRPSLCVKPVDFHLTASSVHGVFVMKGKLRSAWPRLEGISSCIAPDCRMNQIYEQYLDSRSSTSFFGSTGGLCRTNALFGQDNVLTAFDHALSSSKKSWPHMAIYGRTWACRPYRNHIFFLTFFNL